MSEIDELTTLITEVKRLAKKYRELTGRPLGVTGEVAEHEAARLLGLELAPVRTPGYDLLRRSASGVQRLQVKARVLDPKGTAGRLGSIDIDKEFDAVLLVLLNFDLDVTAIYEAPRAAVIAAIERPGSKARNQRRALSVSQFRAIARKVWAADNR